MYRRKATIILLGYIMGIIMELYFEKGIALFILSLLLGIAVIRYVRLTRKSILSQKRFKPIKRIMKYLKIVLKSKTICILILSFLVSLSYTKYLNNKYNNLYSGLTEGKFIGVVKSNPEEKEYITKYKVQIQEIDGNTKYKNTNLYFNVSNDLEKLEYGDLIYFKGEYIEPEIQKNYGGFNYKEYLKTLKIYGTVKCTSKKIDILEKNKANIINIKINEFVKNIKQNAYILFEEIKANLLIGILVGDTTGISEEIEDDFRDSSLIHILAVSGTHINYIILSLVYINNKTKLNKRVGNIMTIIILILFMILVGFSASVVRAVIMGITILLAKLFYRKLDIINSISFSALILLIINPFNIANAGFVLSYGGTIGIVSLSSNLDKLFIKKSKENSLVARKRQYIGRLIESIKEILVVTISAQIIIMPVLARMFNTISLTFFISNLIVSPIMGFITVFGFCIIFISFVSIGVSKVLSIPLNILLKFVIEVANFFGNMKISKIYVVTIPVIFIVIYYVCVYIINYFIYFKYINVGATFDRPFLQSIAIKIVNILKKNYKKILIVLIIIFISSNLFSNLTREFRIHFIDVGQR